MNTIVQCDEKCLEVFGHAPALRSGEREDVKSDEFVSLSRGGGFPTGQFLDPLPTRAFERLPFGHVRIHGSDLVGAIGERSTRDGRIERHSRQHETVTMAESTSEFVLVTSSATTRAMRVRSLSIRSTPSDTCVQSPPNVSTRGPSRRGRSHGHEPVTMRRSFVAESTVAT